MNHRVECKSANSDGSAKPTDVDRHRHVANNHSLLITRKGLHTKHYSKNLIPYRSPRQNKHLVFDLGHVERRLEEVKSTSFAQPTININTKTQSKSFILKLPPNLSCKDQKYMVSLTLSSSIGEGKGQATIAKVDGQYSTSGLRNDVAVCSVCWEKPCDLIFLPCGHVTTCRDCGEKMHLTSMKCPLCRHVITNINNVFHSGDTMSGCKTDKECVL